MDIVIGQNNIISLNHAVTLNELQTLISQTLHLDKTEFFLLSHGKLLKHDVHIFTDKIDVVLTTLGGKGGFGSMLRAIGAQIEKTTNREACRDLSGRRLRDINEEQRLKKWVAQQAEREKEAKERKQKKLEKLCEKPKYEFNDEEYDRERSALPEKVEDAVTKGLEVSQKRKNEKKTSKIPNKKRRLWLGDMDSSDDELSEASSSDSSTNGDDEESQTDIIKKDPNSSDEEDSRSKNSDNKTNKKKSGVNVKLC